MQGEPIEGRVFGGVYRVERKIGAGGMGAVYEARHDRTNRRYALKVLHAHGMRDPDMERRFMREAEAIAALGHANIVSVQDFGRDPAGDPHGTPYIVMDLLDGEDLAHRIRRVGALTWPAAKKIFLEVASALTAAHSVGLVHRDLKPGNVFLAQIPGAGERAVLLDFGLVKMLGDPTRTQLTDVGTILGTPLYMSLEQARGEEVDARADIYSLGCILYEMLAGETPFDAPTPAAFLARLLTEEPTLLTSRRLPHALPPGVDAALSGALAKERERRFASMQAFSDAVAAIDGAGSGARHDAGAYFPTAPSPVVDPRAGAHAPAPAPPGSVTGPFTPKPASPPQSSAVAGAYAPPSGIQPFGPPSRGQAPAPAHGGWPAAAPPSTYVQPPARSITAFWIAGVIGAPVALAAGGVVAYLLLARPFSPPATAVAPTQLAPPPQPPPTPAPALLAPPAPPSATPPGATLSPGAEPSGPSAPTAPPMFGANGQDPMATALAMARAFGGISEEDAREAEQAMREANAQMQRMQQEQAQRRQEQPDPPQSATSPTEVPTPAGLTPRQEAAFRRVMARAAAQQRRAQALAEGGAQAPDVRAVAAMVSSGRLSECVRAGVAAPYNPFRQAYAASCAMRLHDEQRARAICVGLRARNAPPQTLGFCNASNLR